MKSDLRRPCPACESRAADFCGEKNGFDIFVCSDCRSIFTSHLPPPEESENYDEYYSDANLTAPDFVSARIAEIIGGFSHLRRTNRLLDIGFGAGTMLQEAKNQGWEVSGTEVSRPAVEQAREMGYDVHHGVLAEARFAEGSFDVVTASEILEHLPDPEAELAEIVRILRPGGLFWATTPYARCLSFRVMKKDWAVLAPPEHTQLYSKEGARLMLRKAGFSTIKLHTLGLNPAELINYYRPRKESDGDFDRVGAAYDLNEKMTSSPVRKAVKGILNRTLDILQIGDSLKIFAYKAGQ